MRTVRLHRDEFVATVQENRDNHRSVFEEALEGYRDRWIKELERRLHDVRRGREINQYFSLPEPEDHTDDYDRILTMARMSVDDVIELSEDEFAMYVMDQWSWKSNLHPHHNDVHGRSTMNVEPKHANASRVTPQLWIGGDLEVRSPSLALVQLHELDDAGITDIVDLRLEWNDEDWVTEAVPHIRYLWLGVDDAGQRMPDEWFDTGVAHIAKQLNNGGRVLVHCHMGINRGPSMGFAALLAFGWDSIEALDLIRERRPIAYVGYAEDALDWWLRKNGATPAQRAEGRLRIRQWRRANYLDVAKVIRRIRLKECA